MIHTLLRLTGNSANRHTFQTQTEELNLDIVQSSIEVGAQPLQLPLESMAPCMLVLMNTSTENAALIAFGDSPAQLYLPPHECMKVYVAEGVDIFIVAEQETVTLNVLCGTY